MNNLFLVNIQEGINSYFLKEVSREMTFQTELLTIAIYIQLANLLFYSLFKIKWAFKDSCISNSKIFLYKNRNNLKCISFSSKHLKIIHEMKLNTNFYIYISCAKYSPERSGFYYTSLRKLLILQAALCSERGIRYRKIWVEILILSL